MKKTLIKISIILGILGIALAANTFTQDRIATKDFVKNSIQKALQDQAISFAQNIKDVKVGAAPDYFAGLTFSLSGSGISSSATSITLTSFTITQSGQKIQTSDLIAGVGNKFYATIEPGSRQKQEVVSCTGVTQNANGTATLTGCSRGLAPVTPYTASTTLSFVHAGGSQVILSNPPQLYRDIINYIDAAMASGAVDASLTAKGIVEKATGAEAASHASVGSGNTSAPLALTTDIASSTRTGANQVVIVASTTGYIDGSFLNGVATISGNNTWTGNNVFATSTTATTTIGSFPAWEIGKQMKVFTSSGTFVPPTGIRFVKVEVIGGGGGGGSGTNDDGGGGGGGGGGYCMTYADVTATSSIGVTVGAAGTAGNSSAGGTGGTSYFSTYCSATGGAGGGRGQAGGTASSGGAGGVGSLGTILVSGGGGGSGIDAGTITLGGAGGSSIIGGGGAGTADNANACGAAGNYGGGGGGSTSTSGEINGCAGAPGIVIITW